MSNIACMKHRGYNGLEHPELSCKTCCSIFMMEVRRKRDAGIYFDYKNWEGDRRSEESSKLVTYDRNFIERRQAQRVRH